MMLASEAAGSDAAASCAAAGGAHTVSMQYSSDDSSNSGDRVRDFIEAKFDRRAMLQMIGFQSVCKNSCRKRGKESDSWRARKVRQKARAVTQMERKSAHRGASPLQKVGLALGSAIEGMKRDNERMKSMSVADQAAEWGRGGATEESRDGKKAGTTSGKGAHTRTDAGG